MFLVVLVVGLMHVELFSFLLQFLACLLELNFFFFELWFKRNNFFGIEISLLVYVNYITTPEFSIIGAAFLILDYLFQWFFLFIFTYRDWTWVNLRLVYLILNFFSDFRGRCVSTILLVIILRNVKFFFRLEKLILLISLFRHYGRWTVSWSKISTIVILSFWFRVSFQPFCHALRCLWLGILLWRLWLRILRSILLTLRWIRVKGFEMYILWTLHDSSFYDSMTLQGSLTLTVIFLIFILRFILKN